MPPSPETKETYREAGKAQRIKASPAPKGLRQALKKAAVMSLSPNYQHKSICNPREMDLAGLQLACVDTVNKV